MTRLLERRFVARVSAEAAWAHLEKVERWPSWARHIRRVEMHPPGGLTPASRGTILLAHGIKSTFAMEELDPGRSWKWAGPFLWLTVHYDHRFRALGPKETELSFILDAEGLGAGTLGRVFAAIYARNLDRAVPGLVRELEAPRA